MSREGGDGLPVSLLKLASGLTVLAEWFRCLSLDCRGERSFMVGFAGLPFSQNEFQFAPTEHISTKMAIINGRKENGPWARS